VAFAIAVLGPRSEVAAAPRTLPLEEAVLDRELDAEDVVGRTSAGRAVLPRTLGGETWVSVVGFTRRSTASEEREVGGLVVVGFPFDRVMRAGRSSPPALVRVTSRAAQAAPVTPGDAADASLTLTPRLARAAVSAAWRAAGLGADDARLDGIVSRARWSAILPETRLRAVRFDDERLTTDATTDANRLRDSAGANVGLEARLTWRLDRLVYADDEPAFERMRLERHDARSRVAGRVLEALFHWQRACLELRWAQAAARDAREPARTREETEAALRVLEAEAALDVQTAGWFSSWKAERGGAPGGASGPPPPPPPAPEAL